LGKHRLQNYRQSYGNQCKYWNEMFLKDGHGLIFGKCRLLVRVFRSGFCILYYFAVGSWPEALVATSWTNSFFTDSEISFECATNLLTCHYWVAVSLVLKAGIPESLMPLAAFQ
jgi:hypothetical protein